MEQTLDAVLKKLNVTKIYWVDDEHAKAENLQLEKLVNELAQQIAKSEVESISKICGLFQEAEKQKLIELKKKWGKSERDQVEFDPFTQALATLNTMLECEGISQTIDNALKYYAGTMSANERKLFHIIFKSFQEKNNFSPLSFTDWDQQKATILATHNKNDHCLVLLDQANVKEKTSSNGKTVLSDILANESGFRVLLVSSLCNKTTEFQNVKILLDSIDLPNASNIPLFAFSKDRLSSIDVDNQTDILEFELNFAKFLSRFRLSDLSKELAQETQDTIKLAITEAFSRLGRMSFAEFLYAVKCTSDYEGISELDTLLRMFAIEQRRFLFEKVKTDSKVRDLISEMRALEIPIIDKSYLATDSSLSELRRFEVYESKEIINGLFQPLTPGDIFKCTKIVLSEDNEENFIINDYIFIGSECDVMLRAEGKRKLVGDAILLPIMRLNNTDKSATKLPCPLEAGDSEQYVNIYQVCSLPINILDLCAYHDDGAAIWGDDAYIKNQSKLLKSQSNYAKHLVEEVFNSAEKISVLKYRIQHLATATEDNGVTNFRIQRIARLTPEVAKMITYEFSSAIGRPSALHDYSADIKH